MIDKKKLACFINRYTDRYEDLNKILVTAYVRNNRLRVKGGLLASLILDDIPSIEDLGCIESIEDIINIFELAIPKNEQTVNGAVYTPKYIRDYIVERIFQDAGVSMEKCLCADISCGCGAFLYTVAEYIHKKTKQGYALIIKRLYGVDISAASIERAKILLSLAALASGEELDESSFRLYTNDSLTFDFKSLPEVPPNGGFDFIVGNPPYVRSKHIDASTKANLPLWSTSRIGNPDLYIPFFELGYSLLNDNGRIGYITVNSFFKSVNARALRHYFSENKIAISIVDFGQQLIFNKKLAYTCLAFIVKGQTGKVSYAKGMIDDVKSKKTFTFNDIDYIHLDSHKGWNLNRTDVLENIRRIEQAGEALGSKYLIKNGIATLANSIYIFRPSYSDNNYFYLQRDGVMYQIEKGICRDIVKPNILKTETDIKTKEEKVIFPYNLDYTVIQEDNFKDRFPYAYNYLLKFRDILDARDKGEGDYGAWYAFGRTQALTDSGKKLLFPYMSDLPHFIYAPQRDLMIYCGYAIYNESESELLMLKKLLESSVFNYYIRNTSKPYSTGYYSFAKNYVKSFGVYPFNEEEKAKLLSLNDRKAIDEFIANKYHVVI